MSASTVDNQVTQDLPQGWSAKTFNDLLEDGDILKIEDGNHGEKHPKASDYVDDGIPFVMANNIDESHRVNVQSCSKIPLSIYRGLRIGFAKAGDVLLTHKGTLGRVAVVEPEVKELMLTPQVTLYRVSNEGKIDRGYLKYFLASPAYQSTLRRLGGQSTRAYVGITEQKKFTCILPPLNEQLKIAEILSCWDEAIKYLSTIQDLLVRLKASLRQNLFSKENLSTWEEFTLGEVAEFNNGKAHENVIDDSGQYIVVNSKFISTEGVVFKQSKECFSPLHINDIVLVMSDIPGGKALGKCFFIQEDEKYTLNQRICSLRTKSADSKFLFHYLNRNEYFLNFDNGVGQTNLRKDEVLDCPVYLPSLTHQQQIAGILSSWEKQMDGVSRLRKKLFIQKQALMQKLLTAKIRVTV